jgi:hypothetical protein
MTVCRATRNGERATSSGGVIAPALAHRHRDDAANDRQWWPGEADGHQPVAHVGNWDHAGTSPVVV